MDDLKVITASNIINLRTAKGLTQAELGELLNYSDKSVSKWERAEAVPDAYVLKNMSAIFGVSVDYLLSSHDEWKPPESFAEDERNFHSKVITAVVIAGIWTLAFLIYIIGWLLEANWWLIFIYAVPVSLITLLVLNSVWERGKHNRHIIHALVASVFITVYLTFRSYNPWQILLLLVPGELIVFLSFRIKKSQK
ncbi:MAG: helix-turn-helix transcriptional regulator [Oscillospiraceae bacterium]|nr:helix-turn-helix transcriptional regulator [Oscillospiraceae bacterium]